MSQTKAEIVEFRLSKAQQDLGAAKSLTGIREWGGVLNRLYYAAFHAVSALLYQNDLRPNRTRVSKPCCNYTLSKQVCCQLNGGYFTPNYSTDETKVIMKTLPSLLPRTFYRWCHKPKNL